MSEPVKGTLPSGTVVTCSKELAKKLGIEPPKKTPAKRSTSKQKSE